MVAYDFDVRRRPSKGFPRKKQKNLSQEKINCFPLFVFWRIRVWSIQSNVD